MALVRCPACRTPMRVADDSAAQQVRCPSCSSPLRVPSASSAPLPPAPRPTAPPVAVRVDAAISCTCPQCRRPLQFRPQDAGKVTQCPGCRKVFSVPGSPASAPPAAIPVTNPAPRPAPQPAAAPSPPGPTASLPSAHGGRRLRIGVAVALGVLLVVGGGAGVRALFRSTPPSPGTVQGGGAGNPNDKVPQGDRPGGDGPVQVADARNPNGPLDPVPALPPVSDLAFIPGKARALLSIRVADLWKSPPLQKVWADLPEEVRARAEEAIRQTDFDMADCERVTVVLRSELKDEFWAVLRTTRPFPPARREKLLSFAKPINWEERTHLGYRYQLATALPGPDSPTEPLAVHVASEHVMVFGPERGLHRALEHLENGSDKDGKLAHVRSLIENGKDHLLAAAAIQEEDLAGLQPPPELASLVQGPKDVKTALLQVNFDKLVDLKGTMTFPDATKAQALLRQIEGLERLGKPVLPFGGANAAMAELTRQLMGLKAEVNGTDVVVRLQLDLERLVPHFSEMVLRPQGMAVEEGNTGARNLKELALAFEKYHQAHGHYPPAVVFSEDGRTPLYSWRVALLPYLGEQEKKLYDRFDKEKPWSHPTNVALLEKMPRVFAHPGIPAGTTREQTCFKLLTGPNAVFHEGKLVKKSDVRNPDRTLLLVEDRQLVPWTAPLDVSLAEGPDKVLSRLGLLQASTFHAVLFDGSIRKLKRDDAAGFLRLVKPADGAGLPPDR